MQSKNQEISAGWHTDQYMYLVIFFIQPSEEYDQPGKMEVKWSNVKNDHFGKYKVMATNAIGARTSDFEVKEGLLMGCAFYIVTIWLQYQTGFICVKNLTLF